MATRAYELRSTIVSQIILPLLIGDTSVTARTTVAGLLAETERLDLELLARSVGPFAGIPEAAVNDPRVVREDELFRIYVEEGTADLGELVAQVSSAEESGITGLRLDASAALTGVAESLRSEAAAAQADAEDRQQLVLLVAAASVLLALTVGAFASRSITRPLRSLTNQARTMATDSLPAAVQQVLDTPLGDDVVVPELEPIKVQTRDEVADVAAVLTTVQGAALDLALEQAVLRRNIADSFVNMSRRNQNLLDRQLSSITELEREEADPERLDGLFRLDHLATRMRRNAESLLRLAGGGGGVTAGWSGPVPMIDVVRSALGEVEDFQRIDVRSLEPATVSGSIGADLSHALAELVENALHFSPPEERVEVRGRHTDSGGYVIAIVDNGVGMTAEQLEVANRRLAGQESFTVAPSRYLGHYVAGHLASTHGIGIELQGTPAGGITVRIDVPASALVADVPAAAPAPVAAAPAPAPVATAAAAPTSDDLASWLVPAPADASSLLDGPMEPTTTASITDGSAPFVSNEVAQPPVAGVGFGGLAGVAPTAPAADGSTTASGLTKRVRGAQEPSLTPFTSALAPPPVTTPAEPAASAEEVGSFFSAFSSGVERGLADAATSSSEDDIVPRDPDGPRSTGDWGSW
jgi:signal transduction histidine kinase